MSIVGLRNFISNGSYSRLKIAEQKLKSLKSMIRDEQDRLDVKRMMWPEVGVVGEFVTNKHYNYNNLELNTVLYDLGILPYISGLDISLLSDEEIEKVAPFQIPGNNYVRFSPSKLVESIDVDYIYNLEHVSAISLKEKVVLWKEEFLRFDFLNKLWQRERKSAATFFKLNSLTKVSMEQGTISLIESPLRYSGDSVFEQLKIETLLNSLRVDKTKLIELTARGFINQKELNRLRRVTDISRNYLLMTFEKKEEKRLFWKSIIEKQTK